MGIISQGKRLLDAFFTRTQRQLVGIFFGRPDRSFYLNEIVRLAGVGTGSVQRELKRLSGAGVLTERRIGNQLHYQANPDITIFPELCSIARKTFGVVDVIRSAVDQLPVTPDLVLMYRDPSDRPASTMRLLLVSDRLDSGMIHDAVAELQLGREIYPWLLDRRRYGDLLERKDARLMSVIEGPKVNVMGSVNPSVWVQV
jgi:hypothetical protein